MGIALKKIVHLLGLRCSEFFHALPQVQEHLLHFYKRKLIAWKTFQISHLYGHHSII